MKRIMSAIEFFDKLSLKEFGLPEGEYKIHIEAVRKGLFADYEWSVVIEDV